MSELSTQYETRRKQATTTTTAAKERKKTWPNEFFRTVNYICRQRAIYTYHKMIVVVISKNRPVVHFGRCNEASNSENKKKWAASISIADEKTMRVSCLFGQFVKRHKNINNIKQFARFLIETLKWTRES